MMRALVKAKAEPGIWMEEVPVPEIGPNDVLIKVAKTGDLRHRRPHLELGQLGAEDHAGADGDRPRIRRRGRRVRRGGDRLQGRRARVAARATSSAATAATAAPAAASLPQHAGRRRQPAGLLRRVSAIPAHNVVPIPDDIPGRDRRRSSIRSAMPCTPRCPSTWSARTCWSPAPGRSASWRAPVARHVGARKVVITDINRLPARARAQAGRDACGRCARRRSSAT